MQPFPSGCRTNAGGDGSCLDYPYLLAPKGCPIISCGTGHPLTGFRADPDNLLREDTRAERPALSPVGAPQPTPWRPAFEILIVAAAFAIISISAAVMQPMEKIFADAQIYWSVAIQFYESRVPIHAQIPGGSRIATPWLAATLRPAVSRAMPQLDGRVEDASGLLGVTPFLLINIVASAAGMLLLLLYLRRFIDSAVVRIGLVIAWAAMWHSPVRWVYFYPANVDALSMASLLAGLLIIEAWRDRSPLVASLLLAPVVFVGTLIKETIVLVPIAFGIAQVAAAARDRRVDRLVASAVPVVAMAMALLFVRSILVPDPGPQKWIEIDYILRNKPLWTWGLGWFFTFGPPVIALIVAGYREVWAFLLARPDIAGYLAACAVLGYVAGTGSDTERLLALGTPAVYVLAGQAIMARRSVLRRMPLMLALLLVVQIASSRLFWPIPVGVDSPTRVSELSAGWSAIPALADKFLIIDNYYANLWSFFGSRPVHAATLAFDLALTLVVVRAINRAGQHPAAA